MHFAHSSRHQPRATPPTAKLRSPAHQRHGLPSVTTPPMLSATARKIHLRAFHSLQSAGCHRRCSSRNVNPGAMATAAQTELVSVGRFCAEHVSQGTEIMAEAFPYDESSMSRALGLPAEGFAGWMRFAYLPSAAARDHPASLVALAPDGAPLGVLTLEDFCVPDSAAEEDAAAGPEAAAASRQRTLQMAPLEGILDACKALFWREHAARTGPSPSAAAAASAGAAAKVESTSGESEESGAPGGPGAAGEFCYYGFLAVAKQARRQGVGAALVRRANAQARAAGFRWALAFCTSPKSVALFEQAGFERWGGVTYGAYEHDGKRWFAQIPGELAVMARSLQ